MSRLADHTEAAQLEAGAELLETVAEVLTNDQAEPDDLHLLASDLADALQDVLRVAVSRGHRLSALQVDALEGNQRPHLLAAFD